MSTKKELLDKYRKAKEKYKNNPEALSRLQTLVKKEIQELEEFKLKPTPMLPRFTKEDGDLGDLALDLGSMVGRGGLSLLEGAIAKGAELYTGGDLPIGDIMSESFGRTGSGESMGGAESFSEEVLRDPTLLVPGLGQLKFVKNLGNAGKLGTLAAYEAALETTAQGLDSDREMDLGSIVVGGLTPIGGEGLKQLGKLSAKGRYGDAGGELLEEGLIPILGSPKKKLEGRISGLKDERIGDFKKGDVREQESWNAAEINLLEDGVDPQDILDMRYTTINEPLRGFDKPVQDKLVNMEQNAEILTSDYLAVSKEVDALTENLNASVGNSETLFNFSELLKNRASEGGNKGTAARMLLEEIEPQLKDFDIRSPKGLKRTAKLKQLESIEQRGIKEPDYNQMGSVGGLKELVTATPLMRGMFDVGTVMRPDRLRVTPELAKQVFEEMTKEEGE